MNRVIKIRCGKIYIFYLDGKRIYLKIVGELTQQYIIQTFEMEKLSDAQYVNLVDAIYRKRIKDTATLNEHLYSRYRLVPTSKKLV